MVDSDISIEAFSLEKHRKIFAAMREVYGSGDALDRCSVAQTLFSKRQLGHDLSMSYLVELSEAATGIVSVDGCISRVKETSRKRRMWLLLQKSLDQLEHGSASTTELYEHISLERSRMESDGSGRTLLRTVEEIVADYGGMDQFLAPQTSGVRSPWPTLNKLTGGFLSGQLIVIAARTSFGKTALAMQIAEEGANNGVTTAVFSLEMPSRDLLVRLACAGAGVNSVKQREGLLTPDELSRVGDQRERIACMDRRISNFLLFACQGWLATIQVQGQEWTRQFGTAAGDFPRAIAVDATGIYIAGNTYGTFAGEVSAGGLDPFVRKYDSSGTVVWTRQFGTASEEHAQAIALDATGVYVAGFTDGTLPGQIKVGDRDAFLRKYDGNGNLLWTRQFGTTASDHAEGVAADSSGVYVSGWTLGALSGQSASGAGDAFLRKYDTNGNVLWTRQFGARGGQTFGGTVSVGGAGMYLSGVTLGAFPGYTNAGGYDTYVQKYDGNGTLLWTRQLGTAENDGAVVAADASGVYVTGAQGVVSATLTSYLTRLDANGVPLWTRTVGSTGEEVMAAAADATGVYVAALTSSGGQHVLLRKYDATGNPVWIRKFATASFDVPQTVAAGTSGIYAAGFTAGTFSGQTSAGDVDGFVLRLDFTLQSAVPSIGAIVNGASFKDGPLSPGTWLTIFGQNLGQPGQWTGRDTLTLGGANVSACGKPASISYNSGEVTINGVTTWQLNALLPDGISKETTCPVIVTVAGQASQPVSIKLENGTMQLFGFTSSAGPLPIITHSDYSLVGSVAANLTPAKPEETVIAWGTGDCSNPVVTVGGAPAAVAFSGLVGPGLCQINFQVPPTSPAGSNQLKLSTSADTYSLWVAP